MTSPYVKHTTENSLVEFYEEYKKKQGVCGSINGVKAMELANKYPEKKIRLVGYNFKTNGKNFRHVLIIYNNMVMDMSNMGTGGKPIVMSYMNFLKRIKQKTGVFPYIMNVEPVNIYEQNRKKISSVDMERYGGDLKWVINFGIDMGNSALKKLLEMEAVEGECWANSIEEYASSNEPRKLEKLGINLGD
tara:strand:- start:1066 stop:1635 length:570 start_codon:yes stop_codon:yes gene_type:complete